jgi:methyl-accepting chemotaxis protein
MLKQLSVSKLLYLLLSVFILGFLSLEIFTFFQTQKVIVKGPTYNQIVQGKDLIADILPPPLYIIESYLNILELIKETDSKKQEKLLLSVSKLESDFNIRHDYWIKELPTSDLKKELIEDAYTPALEFYSLYKKELIPLLQSKDLKKAEQLVTGKMKDAYILHREKIDSVVSKANLRSSNDEQESQKVISSTIRTLIIMAFIFLLLFTLLFYVILKNVLRDQVITKNALDEATRSFNMIEKSSISILMGSSDGKLVYLNEMAKLTLRKFEDSIPEKVENLIGRNFDYLYRNPSEKSLPLKTIITLGNEKLDLLISPIYDSENKYIGPMMTFEVVTAKVVLISNLTLASENLASAASNVLSISSNLSAAVEETAAQANTASVASEEVSSGVQIVAGNMQEMFAAIKQVTKTTDEAALMTKNALNMSKNANTIIAKLGESSLDIGNVIKVISSIAQQTNLLALNATIEAARAGEAGKGFSVVANEVKELANQTAKATQEIIKKIETIQSDSKNAVEAIVEISGAIEKINEYTGSLSASIEEQAATTNEVNRVIADSAVGIKQISENISQVSTAASNTGKDAMNAQSAAKSINNTADLLKSYVADL